MAGSQINATDEVAGKPTFREAFGAFARIGILSFGGPTAQIALMHRIIVDERKWLTEQQFLNALSFCMLLPGPEAMQLATYAGWRLHGVRGGLMAGLLFVMPGALVMLALASIYTAFGNVPFVEAVFFGIKAAVLVIVVEALLRISRRALQRAEHWMLALLSLIALFFLALPYPLIVLAAAVYGFVRAPAPPPAGAPAAAPVAVTAAASATAGTIVTWLVIWLAPLFALAAVLGKDNILVQLGWFFSKLAVVTFGGAYAVLAYMGQDVVVRFGWLEAGQMMDGLGLAETTPGPLILVTEFVAFVAAFQHQAAQSWTMGLAGAVVALWVTFVPCFLWIFAGAPYIEWLNAQPRLKGALTGITAAVVGVMLNLAIWFALHVFFGTVTREQMGPLQLWTPELATLDWRVVGLAAVSGVLLLYRKWDILNVLLVAAALALVLKFAGL